MLILKQNAANTVPTPPAGKGTIFLDDSDTLSVKTSDGNVETFPTVAASNAQVLFMNGTSLSGEAALTYDFNNNVLNISGNVAAGNVKTDNLLYANGVPWDLSDPGGSNTQIQFNDDESFGGSAAFTFNKSSNLVTVSANLNANNINVTTHITSGNVYANSGTVGASLLTGTLTTASQPNITSVGTLSSLVVSGNANVANLNATGHLLPTAGNTYDLGSETAPWRDLWVSGSSIRIGGARITANATSLVLQNPEGGQVVVAGNSVASSTSIVSGTSNVSIPTANGNVNTSVGGAANVLVITATGANITGTLNATGNANVGNLGTTGVVATTLGGNLTTAAQPNITSVGTLSSLDVSGNANVGNIGGTNGVFTTVAGTLSTAAQPNITSVGTLTGLGVNGNITAANITANTGVFTGNAAGLTNIPGGNITGNITGNISNAAHAVTSNTVVDAAQPNITSVGTLTGLTLAANADITLSGTGSEITGANLVSATNLTGTLTTAAQPNVTSVGTLTSLGVNGTVTAVAFTANTGVFTGNGSGLSQLAGGNVTGQVANALVAGTVYTAAQPNVTSVGTLTGLDVNGNITAANITANTGIFTGNGSGLSALVGANVTGQVANATVAGTVYTNAQPNITSVGTLSSLAVTGNATAGNVYANSGTIGASLLTGTLTTAAQPNITSVGTLSSLAVTGNVAAGNLTTTGVLSVTGTGVSSIAGNLDMTSNNIINLAAPVNSTDAATKQYVDDIAQGLHVHAPSAAATPDTLANISGGTVTYNNGTSGVGATLTTTGTYTTIDTVNIASVGTRILVKNEANAAHNGIYTYTSSTVLTRATDFDTPAEMAGGDFTFVSGGATYNDTGWVMTDPVTTVGTTNVVFVQFSGAGTYTAGTGLTLTGSVFSVNASQTQVTSVGTLTGLAVNGNITAANITANTGVFTGNGSGLTALAGANVTGQVGNALVAGTVYTNAQPNITSVGTLSSLTVTGNVSAGNVSGTLLTGTLATAAQPNVTSLGTLTSLGVNGTVTAVAFTANTGVFTGNGSGLSALAGGNVTGQVANALVAGTVYTAAQPNITSVGTLTGLGVNGNITAANITANTGVFTGNGSGLSAIAGANVTGTVSSATTAGTVTTAAQPNITSVGTLTSLGVNGTVTAVAFTANTGVFTGNGSGLSAIAGANVTGTVSAATTAGTVTTAAQPNITSVGTLTGLTLAANADITMSGTGSNINGVALVSATLFEGSGANLTNINASNVSSGTLAQARLANASLTLGSTTLTLGGTTTTVAGLSSVTSTSFVGALTGAATTAGTVTTAAQPNITSVGTLTGLTVSATITGSVSGSAGTAGTVTTAAQPNITSVGTLTSLSSSGNIVAPNVQANTGFFISSINAAVSAAGTAQGNATALTREINVTSTVASGAGVALPTAVAGMRVTIINTAANAVLVYPASGGTINSLALNAAFSQVAGGRLDFVATSTTQWYTLNATYA